MASSVHRCGQRLGTASHQLPQQPVGEIVEIVHPLAQIGVGHVQHARAHVALHLLDRRLGGQAVAHRPPPAGAPSPGRWRTCGRLPAPRGARPRRRHRGATACRRSKAAASRAPRRAARSSVSVSSLKRLVTTMRGSCSTTWPSPMPSLSGRPVKLTGRDRSSSSPGRVSRARSPVAIISAITMAVVSSASTSSSRYCRMRPVLHDEHAERAPGAQHRHAEEGIVDLLARLRQVGEGRMLLRIGEVERPRARRDRADEALAEPQLRQVDRAGVEALGGVEFEHGVGAQHIERADLGDHVGAIWRTIWSSRSCGSSGFRHELAQPSQQARAGPPPCHASTVLSNGAIRPCAPPRAGNRLRVGCSLLTAYPARRRNAKSEPQVRYRPRRSGSRS